MITIIIYIITSNTRQNKFTLKEQKQKWNKQ